MKEQTKNKQRKMTKNASKGITLIALVITIIVLLILAGVSIATLTGENGILTQATTAKEKNSIAGEKESIALAYNAVKTANKGGAVTAGELNTEFGKNNVNATAREENGKIKVEFDTGRTYTINSDGTIGDPTTGVNPPAELSELEKAKNEGTVYETNTNLTDKFGNIVKVPEGFKIASDSATDVTGGVVIEDVNHTATAGSQFVWIPVGTIYTNIEKTSNVIINLDRYTFDKTTGEKTAHGANAINDGYNYQELATSTYGNKTAKEIEVFKTKVSRGYYIGRYEARTETERKDKTDTPTQITIKPNDYVYNYVTQSQAAELSRNMYDNSLTFTSDLMNSYAWDTATLFAQTFDNRENKTETTKPYSIQNSLNTKTDGLAPKGTNNLTDTAKQDKICNIWDMASNDEEWTTETCIFFLLPCVSRGGNYYNSGDYTSIRDYYGDGDSHDYLSFRPLLYL